MGKKVGRDFGPNDERRAGVRLGRSVPVDPSCRRSSTVSVAHSFHVHIDESGDGGMSNFRQIGSGGGASHWLAVGACVVRASRDLELVALLDRLVPPIHGKCEGKVAWA